MWNKRRIVAVGTALTLGLLLLALVEAAGRAVPRLMPVQWQIEYFAIHYPFTVLPDPELGFTMPPNQHEVIRTDDYTFLAETDARGYPNRDPWPDHPTIVFLGDSLIIGAGVGLDGSFTGLVARRLPDQSVVNLGLAGAGPERQARIYRRFSAGWRPSLVVSCLFLASDVENDFHFLSWVRDGNGSDYNQFRLNLARDARYRGILQRILDKSWLLYSGQQVLKRWIEGDDYFAPRFRFPDETEVLFDRHALEFATTAVADNDPRIATFLTSLGRLRDIVEQTGATLLVVLLPSKEELFGASPEATRVNLAARIKQRMTTANFEVLDLYPALQRGGAQQAPFYSLDIHLNAYGNRIVAEEFAAWFKDNHRGPD